VRNEIAHAVNQSKFMLNQTIAGKKAKELVMMVRLCCKNNVMRRQSFVVHLVQQRVRRNDNSWAAAR
jgi:hypothetical protein